MKHQPQNQCRSRGTHAGNAKVSFAHAEPNSRYNLSDITTTATLNNNEWLINGNKCVVFGGGQADYILLAARTTGKRLV